MTVATLPARSDRRSAWGGIPRFVSLLIEGIREGRALAARYEALSRLSDSELARRGLTRHDIPQVVVTGRRI